MANPISGVGSFNGVVTAWNGDFSGSTTPALTNGLISDNQLWIGSTTANANGTHINVGTITSTGGTITVSHSGNNINVDTAASLNVSLSPYIVGSTKSDFTNISSAVAAAIGNGASNANQFNIYIKPGTYSTGSTITIPAGINLVGFGAYPADNGSNSTQTVRIKDQINFTNTGDAYNSVSSIWFENGVNLNNTGSLFFTANDCYFSDQGTISGIQNETGTNSATLGNCALIDVNCLSGSIDIRMFGGQMNSNLGSNSSGGTINIEGYGSAFYGIELHKTAAFTLTTFGGKLQTSKSSSGNPTVILNNSSMDYSIDNFGTNVKCFNCIFNGVVVNKGINAFLDSQVQSYQSGLNTVSGVAQTLATIALSSNMAYTITGTITAQKADFTDYTMGTFTVLANRAGAGAVILNQVNNVFATSTGTFSSSASGNNILIQVTAISAASYNWVTSYSVAPIASNA